jgi:hypothetical protein
MRVLDADDLLSVAHHVDGEPALATPSPVGLELPATKLRRKSQTRCGLAIGPTWVAADRYDVPDCGDCVPAAVAYEQTSL